MVWKLLCALSTSTRGPSPSAYSGFSTLGFQVGSTTCCPRRVDVKPKDKMAPTTKKDRPIRNMGSSITVNRSRINDRLLQPDDLDRRDLRNPHRLALGSLEADLERTVDHRRPE